MLRMMGVLIAFVAATGVAFADLAPRRRSPPDPVPDKPSVERVRDYGYICPDPATDKRLKPDEGEAARMRVVCGDGKAYIITINYHRRRGPPVRVVPEE
jgi:hypothetical protein